MEECAVSPVVWAAGGERLLIGVVRARRRRGGGLATMAAGHSEEQCVKRYLENRSGTME